MFVLIPLSPTRSSSNRGISGFHFNLYKLHISRVGTIRHESKISSLMFKTEAVMPSIIFVHATYVAVAVPQSPSVPMCSASLGLSCICSAFIVTLSELLSSLVYLLPV